MVPETVHDAQRLLESPETPTAMLADIAHAYPVLATQVAVHPNADRYLLDWLAQSGDPQVVEILAQREEAGTLPEFTQPVFQMPASRMSVNSGSPASEDSQLAESGTPKVHRELLIWSVVFLVTVLVVAGYFAWDYWSTRESEEVYTPTTDDIRCSEMGEYWVLTLCSTGMSMMTDVVILGKGKAFATGYSTMPNGDFGQGNEVEANYGIEMTISKKSATWTPTWTTDSQWSYESLVSAPNGSVAVVGIRGSIYNQESFLAMISPKGHKQWEAEPLDPESRWWAVASDSESAIYGIGASGQYTTSHGSEGQPIVEYPRTILTKIDKEGTQQWSVDRENTMSYQPTDMIVDLENNIYVVGWEYVTEWDQDEGVSFHSNAAVEKYDFQGQRLWHRSLVGVADFLGSVEILSDGGIIMGGARSRSSDDLTEPILIRMTSEGVVEWQKSDYFSSGVFYDLVLTDDNSILAVGNVNSTDDNSDAGIMKFTEDGDLLWSRTYGGSGSDAFTALTLAPKGQIIATGYTNSPDGDFGAINSELAGVVVKLTSEGDLVKR